jgi:hypothetical protein
MNVQDTDKHESFAYGLYSLFTRGVFCKKCRLNNRIKKVLIVMLNETSENSIFFGRNTI